MKIYKYFIFILVCLFSVNAFAQKNEVKVMYSPLSLQRIDNWGRDLDGLSGKYTGAFMIDYNRYLSTRLKLGVNITYDQSKESGTKTGGYKNPHPPYEWITTTTKQSNKEGWFFFGPQIGYDYVQKNNFRLGSLIGVSMVLLNKEDIVENSLTSKKTDINFFFHAEVLNFTWGRTHGLTGQLGYGHKGLVGIGYFVRW